jgi:uncharacterized protein (DUF3820 family)
MVDYFIMKWGIYRGHKFEHIPSDYLEWLIKNCKDGDTFALAFAEYQLREDEIDCHFYRTLSYGS